MKSVVKSDYGMSIRDVMSTDYEHLMIILNAEEVAEKEQEEVMNLGEFINSLKT